MDFQYFLKYVPNLAEVALPAVDAHVKMAPVARIESLKNPTPHLTARKAAVMMLFYPKNQQTHLVLIVRNTYEGIHSGQVAFPGGKFEETDTDLTMTALRETHEEVGVEPKHIEVIKPFTTMFVPPSNFVIHPFLGIAKEEISFIPDPDEVAKILELPLAVFLDDETVIQANLATSYAQEINVPAFNIENNVVWGATAMILSELKEVLKSVFDTAV